jgi:hypothetical protein
MLLVAVFALRTHSAATIATRMLIVVLAGSAGHRIAAWVPAFALSHPAFALIQLA